MNTETEFDLNVGDVVRLKLDGNAYKVLFVSPSIGGVPGDKHVFIVHYGRWPWSLAKTHYIPIAVADNLLSIIPQKR